MALSNREHLDRAFDLLAGALEPFIAKVLMPRLPAEAKDWTVALAAKDAEKGRTRATYSAKDPQVQLRVITEPLPTLGYAFNDVLSRTEQGYASELREVRDKVAHHESFTASQARRALETMELLLRAAGAVQEADRLRLTRREIERADFERETRKATRSQALTVRTEDTGLPSWREVLKPHADVRSGDFASSEFAADLYRVAVKDTRGTADEPASEYTDAVEFFRRTYLTEGLRELLQRAAARLSGDTNADAVINLQTTFGGGKTHSMLAVWHLFSGRPLHEFPQDVQDVLAGHPQSAVGGRIRRVTIVGNEISPGQPVTKPDGTVVHTLWGEIAWQLGAETGEGAAAYAHVAEADRSGTNPGGSLRALFAAYGPAVILIDEWVAYARQLNTHRLLPDGSRAPLPAGDFETQFTFAQALTQAAAAVPGVLLLVSIPASARREDGEDDSVAGSDLEVGGDFGHEALSRLDNVVRRVAYQWAPAARDESYEIVRRRLFEQPSADQLEQIAVTARRFREFYQRFPGEFPQNVLDSAFEARIRASYPVHPELLDRLYAEWSTLEKFQRTRGVLRLMSAVVHQLWTTEDPSPLITPGTVPLDSAAVRRELVQYLPHGWDSVIQNDVDGDESVARRIDDERPNLGNRSLTVRVARSVLLESAPTVATTHKGVPRRQLLLALAMPGDVVGNVSSAINALQDTSSYFYAADGRYWYDTQPSLNRTAADRARQLEADVVWDEIVARLRRIVPRSTAEFDGIVVAPRATSDVPEDEAVRLVLLHPEHLHQNKDLHSSAATFVHELLTTRGVSARTAPNTLIALAPDVTRWKELESSARSHMAWRSIYEEKTALDLTHTNELQVQRQVESTNRVIEDQIPATWIWGLHADQPDPRRPFQVSQVRCDGQVKSKTLVERTGTRYVKEDLLRTEMAAPLVRMELEEQLLARWNTGSISFGALWECHTRYPYMARLRDRDVLARAVASVLYDPAYMQQGFALAMSYDETTGEFGGLALPLEDLEFGPVTDTTLLVRPDLARRQRDRETAQAAEAAAAAQTPASGTDASAASTSAGAGHGATSAGDGMGTPRPPAPPTPAVSNASYSGNVEIAGDADLSSTFQTLVDEVLTHLQKADPDTLEIVLQINAEKFAGFDAGTVRTVGENARQLGFIKTQFKDR